MGFGISKLARAGFKQMLWLQSKRVYLLILTMCVCLGVFGSETEEYKSVKEQFEEPDGIGGSGGHSGRTFLLLQFD